MTTTILESTTDMDWLFEVHFKGRKPAGTHLSAMIYGNEDWPDRVDLFGPKSPKIGDHYCRFMADENGDLRYIGMGIIGDDYPR